MPKLYPLLIKPEFHERVWGTRDLRPIYDLQPQKPVGEAWLTGDQCRVQNGELAGRTLGELCREFGADLVGEAAPQKDRFPLLIKFLFPREKLSVQVHPDDEMARSMGQPCGKTECWYVHSAEPGAQVGVGLKSGVTKTEFAEAIKGGTAEQLLNWINVHPGELIYVEAGTVHAIGPGSVLVETQQNSDTTFRLYDYGRPRELHLEQGLAAINPKAKHGKIDYGPRQDDLDDPPQSTLLSSRPFWIDRIDLAPNLDSKYFNQPHFRRGATAIICLGGAAAVQSGAVSITAERGVAVVVPANQDSFVCSAGNNGFEALITFNPGRNWAQPRLAQEAGFIEPVSS